MKCCLLFHGFGSGFEEAFLFCVATLLRRRQEATSRSARQRRAVTEATSAEGIDWHLIDLGSKVDGVFVVVVDHDEPPTSSRRRTRKQQKLAAAISGRAAADLLSQSVKRSVGRPQRRRPGDAMLPLGIRKMLPFNLFCCRSGAVFCVGNLSYYLFRNL